MGRILVRITRYNEWLIDFVFLYIYKVAIIKEIFFQILSINPEKEIDNPTRVIGKKPEFPNSVQVRFELLWVGMPNSVSILFSEAKKFKKCPFIMFTSG